MNVFTHKGAMVTGTIVDESATHYMIEKEDGDAVVWPKASTECVEVGAPGVEIYGILDNMGLSKAMDYTVDSWADGGKDIIEVNVYATGDLRNAIVAELAALKYNYKGGRYVHRNNVKHRRAIKELTERMNGGK